MNPESEARQSPCGQTEYVNCSWAGLWGETWGGAWNCIGRNSF